MRPHPAHSAGDGRGVGNVKVTQPPPETAMNLETAIKSIHSVKGFTSVVEALLGGDKDSIKDQSAVGKSLVEAEAELARVRKAQTECKSDAAYWGYQGDASYWSAVVNLLKAADLVGPDDMPDIEFTKWGGVVMDECSKVEDFGRRMLIAATEKKKSAVS